MLAMQFVKQKMDELFEKQEIEMKPYDFPKSELLYMDSDYGSDYELENFANSLTERDPEELFLIRFT